MSLGMGPPVAPPGSSAPAFPAAKGRRAGLISQAGLPAWPSVGRGAGLGLRPLFFSELLFSPPS